MKPCKDGKHDLIRIITTSWGLDGVMAVVKWCKYCGAVVIDGEYDNRTNPGKIRPMQLPEISK